MNREKLKVMRKIIILFALLLVAVLQGVYAQSTIFGNVTDSKDGSGIAGASVIVKGTITGTTTNSSGNFAMMNVPNDATLQVSYIGYKTFEMAVENQTRFEIKLQQDVQVLSEVVVTAPTRVAPPQTVEINGMVRSLNSIPAPVRHVSGSELIRVDGGNLARTLAFAIPNLTIVKLEQGAGAAEVLYSMDGVPISRYVIDGVLYNIIRSRGPLGMTVEFDDSFLSMFNIYDIESVTYIAGRSVHAGIYIKLKK